MWERLSESFCLAAVAVALICCGPDSGLFSRSETAAVDAHDADADADDAAVAPIWVCLPTVRRQ